GNGGGIAAGGRSVFCVVVLVVAGLAGVSCGHDGRGAMAVDRGGAVGVGICSGAAVRVGFRANRTRDARTSRSAEAAGRGRFLPLRAQSYVRGVPDGLGGIVGGVWVGESGGDPGGVSGAAGSASVCDWVRGANAAQNVRRGILGILPERAAVGAKAEAVGKNVKELERTKTPERQSASAAVVKPLFSVSKKTFRSREENRLEFEERKQEKKRGGSGEEQAASRY